MNEKRLNLVYINILVILLLIYSFNLPLNSYSIAKKSYQIRLIDNYGFCEKLILPIIRNKSLVVYGSRVLNKNRYKTKGFTSLFRIFANHILTIISNIINNQSLTDAHTCYKVFDIKIFKKIKLVEDDFAFCPEVTTKISNMGYKIHEVPINYKGRNYSQGKKIKLKDGFKALFALIKYKFFSN